LAGLGNEYRARLENVRAEDPDSPRAHAIERDLDNLEHLRRFALPVMERLGALPEAAAWGEWIPALEALAPTVLRRPDRVLTVLAELRPLGVIGPVPLSEVRETLAEELANLQERPPDVRYGRVFVGSVEQARGRSFSVVFLPGLAERMFPRPPREDPILLDEFRASLGAHLTTQSDRGQRERLLLRLAVGAASQKLYLSYSRLELAEARPRVPSFYALEVARALTGDVPDPQAMERAAAARADARLAWPAPDDATRAIDAVEHDLATLGALLKGPESHGRARYLLELSPCLARSLRTRWARWNQKRWSSYDGIVAVTDRTRAAHARARLGARPYSASALQKFAACPYQFFLSAICRLAPRAEVAPIVELDPMTRGAIFHRVQAELMREFQRMGQLPLTIASREASSATLDRVLDRVADDYREKLAPAIHRVWQDEVESMRADLRMWLERSVETDAEWEPAHFELAFGLPSNPEYDPRSSAGEVLIASGFRLRGIVDLVERKRGGAGLRVSDYKTGRPWWKPRLVVGGGEMLQPVLYGLAVEQLFGERVVESRLLYCTRIGNFEARVVPMSDDARGRGRDVLGVTDRAIERGFLAPAPRRKACDFCDFLSVCGPYEEIRLAQKDRAPLEELLALRDWP
jgi:ATP-dependent helicase/nuclease subunit B